MLTSNLRGEKLAFLRILMVVAPCFFLFGYNQSAIGGVLAFTPFIEQFPRINTATTTGAVKSERALIQGNSQVTVQILCKFLVTDSALVGTVVAIYTIGCLVGALASSYVANPLGRRSAIVMFAMIAALGAVLQGSSFSLGQLVTGRIISGLGVGGVNSVVPVWQAESSKPKNRGKSVVVMGIFIASGIAMTSWVNFGLSYRQQTSLCWRLPLTIPIMFCLTICITTFMFPESPRWLVQKGRIEEAKAVISSLEDVPIDSEHIAIEIDFIRQSCNNGAVRERGFFDILKTGRERLLYRTSLSILINFCAQMTGMRSKDFPNRAMTDF